MQSSCLTCTRQSKDRTKRDGGKGEVQSRSRIVRIVSLELYRLWMVARGGVIHGSVDFLGGESDDEPHPPHSLPPIYLAVPLMLLHGHT